jgi:putative hydrolase of the HAD superfamily
MVDLVHDLRDGGFRIGILTNNVREFREWWWPLMDFEAVFDTVVDSHEVAMRKPNPEIYHLTMDRLGAEPARTAFLDDLQANVDAANAVGMHGILVEEDQSSAIARARRLAGLG